MLRLCPAAWKGPGEAPSAQYFSVGAGLDAAAVGRPRNKAGICREINTTDRFLTSLSRIQVEVKDQH